MWKLVVVAMAMTLACTFNSKELVFIVLDASPEVDAGADGGADGDGGAGADGGAEGDGGAGADAGAGTDADGGDGGAAADAGTEVDAGSGDGGVCAAASAGTVVVAATCAFPTTAQPATVCDGDGGVSTPSAVSCGLNYCDAGACGSCANDDGCVTGAWCGDAGTCSWRKDAGVACVATNECVSSNCVTGVCCTTTCAATAPEVCGQTGSCATGTCDIFAASTRCAAPGCVAENVARPASYCSGAGACLDAGAVACGLGRCDADAGNCPACAGDQGCVTGAWCDAGGCLPKKDAGATCGAPNECSTTNCVSGNCCTTACTPTAPEVCGHTGSCATGSCASWSAATSCISPVCLPGNIARLASYCSGAGSCLDAGTLGCGLSRCDAGTCPACASDNQCVVGAHCDAGKCEWMAWRQPQFLGSSGATSSKPLAVAVDPAGNAFAVGESGGGLIYGYRYKYSEGSWGSPMWIGIGANPSVAVTAAGEAYISWSDGTGYSSSRYPLPDGPGGAIDFVGAGGEGIYASQGTPVLAANASGDVVLLMPYTTTVPGPPPTYLDTAKRRISVNWWRPQAGRWGDAGILFYDATAPHVAFDGFGNAVAAFIESSGSNWAVKAARYLPDAGWGAAAVAIESNWTASVPQPRVAVDSPGNALVVWAKTVGSDTNIWWNRFAASSGGWADAGRLETDGGSEAPHVAVDPSGNAIAAWSQAGATKKTIVASRFAVDGGSWSAPRDVGFAALADVRNPRVCFDAAGNATVVWWSEDYYLFGWIGDSYWANHYRPDGGWVGNDVSGIRFLGETDAGAPTSSPRVACAPGGGAIAVWDQWDGANYNIGANVYR